MTDKSSAIPVRSIDEEDTLIGVCGCGGSWKLSGKAVFPRGHQWLDSVRLTCPSCGRNVVHVFDISRFFQPRPGVWSHP